MNSIIIEPMVETDLNIVAEVFLKTFNQLGENWSIETTRTHTKENFLGGYHFIARKNGTIVGFIMAIPLTREGGLELFIDSIAVLPEYQKKGIGTQLWKKMKSLAKEKDFVGIRLLTNKHLQSFEWYKKMGFSESNWVEVFKNLK